MTLIIAALDIKYITQIDEKVEVLTSRLQKTCMMEWRLEWGFP